MTSTIIKTNASSCPEISRGSQKHIRNPDEHFKMFTQVIVKTLNFHK